METSPSSEEHHDNSWSVNLEQPRHEGDRERIVEEAISAVERTAAGNHVNVVTHGECGHPEEYLLDALERALDGIEVEYVDRCGCGGHVTRVHV
ncbi:CGCGG family rSAM-modified RiPP protein [Haloarculaceae archaeon H-GB2-1]|nr:CGCGG family rSAM-modified RiPP protein [Haloarculaceae archaeon H-GB1-1]MEA5388236.1 CGCGG family rSAM-modified RiPP protein [Haloarculaceae archaeon H-GB11]MEA5406259.1 CGCGG family rSAM-modified RiPP protein [Haloarculaceae archaeon H-GB2-1]